VNDLFVRLYSVRGVGGRTSAAAIWLTTSLLNFLIGLGPAGSYSTSIIVISSFIVFVSVLIHQVKSSQLPRDLIWGNN